MVSLQRPGGNATGLMNLERELAGKRLQLLKEAFPRVSHVALLVESANIGSMGIAKDVEEAATILKIRISRIEIREAADIEPAFKRGATLGVQAYVPAGGALSRAHRQDIVDRIARSRLPAIFTSSEPVESGGLMS